ncbi:unnamed protein product [Kluyveromyces dobzhanskii CBS 2104]|uniref:Dolichyl-phosphate-mannose--protein mannosyltransferase n=1 Tax=Kluyveromyces dobzhanskii CBS 2104 TaxID=1427455 RepID=A0A0A8L230_9SACH|nr:unnamed protein product [Kluyveromyces dobzhanskii CBS 2104]
MAVNKRGRASGAADKSRAADVIEADELDKYTKSRVEGGGRAAGYEYVAEKWLLKGTPDCASLYSYLHYIVLGVAVVLRFWRISEPREVVFDEVHFGKFASYYLERTYFFDVHPPMAKMAIAAVGWLVGYNGKFKFDDIGYSYDTYYAPFVAYRSLSAVLGVLTVSVVFSIMKELNFRAITCFIAAFLIAIDNAHVTETRLILLDAMLILSIALSIYCYIRFYKQQLTNPLSSKWYLWLYLTGFSLSMVMSTKYVGLLTYCTIGLAVAVNLWQLLDIRSGLHMRKVFKHILIRINGLILFPFVVYLFWFWCHFAILNKSGPGDAFMSSDFQDTLYDAPLALESKNVNYYDIVTIKHKATEAFLHSHLAKYPVRYDDGRISSNGQQVTGYAHEDFNNQWEILPPRDSHLKKGAPVKLDANIRLRHIATNSYLLAHDVASPFYPTNEEVTTSPEEAADSNEYDFTLFRFQPIMPKNSNRITKTKNSAFRLFHVETAVALWTHNDKLLPEWGFAQQEVNGNKKVQDPENSWFIDSIVNMQENDARHIYTPKVPKPMSFLQKWYELQFLMFEHNNKLSSEHPFASNPQSWPLSLSGVSFWTKEEGRKQIFFTGNIVGWWFGIVSVALYLGLVIADLTSRQRAVYALNKMARQKLYGPLAFFLFGWCIHYFPFFLMARQKFLHHYLPAHLILVMFSAALWETVFTDNQSLDIDLDEEDSKNPHEVKPKIYTVAYYLFCLTVVINVGGFFVYFAPLVYGFSLTLEQIQARQWFDIKLQYAK